MICNDLSNHPIGMHLKLGMLVHNVMEVWNTFLREK